ncbi:hypothetical protein T4E_8689 [Trichinella pseudospiralis]|uniref:Uncharacterized protein n=1 Tax=Trichinella pseudospiralis TaxID=6337 RepID=A0A0V0Y5R0_TRIPS|nr:hypothetical protein T4E_2465 [Trichinella pseudospiralis]KRX95388.1 hypothetical protein T4E_8689 [Trichinella pseudospiralis]
MAPQKPIQATIFIADGAISLPAYSNVAGPAEGSNSQGHFSLFLQLSFVVWYLSTSHTPQPNQP